METLWQDLRYAARRLRGSPGFALAVVLTLAVGIGANTAVFSIMDALVFKQLPVNHPEQLVEVFRGDQDSFSNPLWEQLRDHEDVFSGVFAWSEQDSNLSVDSEVQRTRMAFVSGECFSTLGVNTILGRVLTPDDDRRGGGVDGPVAVINYNFWRSHYSADPEIIGKTISIDRNSFRIVGVAQPHFSGMNVGNQTDVFIPVATEPILRLKGTRLDKDGSWWLQVFARPRPGLNRFQIGARLNVLAPQLYDAALKSFPQKTIDFFIQQKMVLMSASSGTSGIRKEYSQSLILLIALTGSVLLISCANIANLLLARSVARQREIAIRRAVGASIWRLLRQFLTESLLLSSCGGILSLLFARWAEKALILQLSSSKLPLYLDLSPDLRVLSFEFGLVVLTALLFGLAPALRTWRISAQQALKSAGASIVTRHRFNVGNWLVIGEVAATIVMLIGTALLVRTFRNLETVDAGFNRDHVLLLSMNTRNGHFSQDEQRSFNNQLLGRLRSLPGVRVASQSSVTPLNSVGYKTPILASPDASSRRAYNTDYNVVSSNYFAALDTPFIAGRDFGAEDGRGSPMVVVINQAMARKLFTERNPIGQSLRRVSGSGSTPYEVIGVVKNSKITSLGEVEPPAVYFLSDQEQTVPDHAEYELRTGENTAGVAAVVRDTIGVSDSRISYEFRTLKVQVEESISIPRILAELSGILGGFALIVSMLGLYAVISHMTARRTNEFGIRMALGASRWQVLSMVAGSGARLALIGSAIGIPIAFWITRLLSKFLYGVDPHDAWSFAGVALTAVLVALLAAYIPARRATHIDPVSALRHE